MTATPGTKPSLTVFFFRALRSSVQAYYDRMTIHMLLSLFYSVLAGLIIWGVVSLTLLGWRLPALLAGLIGAGVLSIVWTAYCAFARETMIFNGPDLGWLPAVIRRYLKSAFVLGLIQAFITAVIIGNVVFYGVQTTFVLKLLSLLLLYVLYLWSSAVLYQPTLLIEHVEGAYAGEQRSGRLIVEVIRRSVFMVLGNLPHSLSATAAVLFLYGIGVLLIIGLPLASPVLTAHFTARWTRSVLMRYDVIETPPEPAVEPVRPVRQ